MTGIRLPEEAGPAEFASVDPATGRELGRFPIHTASQVRAAVERSRQASRWWAGLGEPARRARLQAWRRLLARRTGELAELIHAENGKPVPDAVLEVTIAVAHLAWAAAHAGRVLRRRRVWPGLLAANHTAAVEYLPYGVIGVIGPWNYPVHTPLGSISYALAAGNAVVFKPSEYTPAVAGWLADSLAEVVPEQPVLQLVTGYAATGAALCAAGVDKLAFTGSSATARRVLAACAESLTPCVAECGGKDALIVAADADLELAAEQAVWGGLSNAGQTCAGVERIYVESAVYERFTAKLLQHARAVRPGRDYGPMTMPAQLDTVAAQLDDALARGARVLLGGRAAIGQRTVAPIVLTDVPEDSPALAEETFGPVLVLSRVHDLDEAIERANASRYGLGAAVFSRGQGPAVAGRLEVGMVSINSVLTYAAVPGLPWGGRGESGFGRIHGAEGLREFARSRAVTRQRLPSLLAVTSFDRPASATARLQRLSRLRWGGR